MYSDIVDILHGIQTECRIMNANYAAKGRSLELATTQFEFLIRLLGCRNLLVYVLHLSVRIQGHTIGTCGAMHHVPVSDAQVDCRTNINTINT